MISSVSCELVQSQRVSPALGIVEDGMTNGNIASSGVRMMPSSEAAESTKAKPGLFARTMTAPPSAPITPRAGTSQSTGTEAKLANQAPA